MNNKPIKIIFENCCVCPADTTITCQYSKLSSKDFNTSTIITIECDNYLKDNCIMCNKLNN